MWGDAKIIDCDNISRRVKIHFTGFSKRYDIWTHTDRLAANGTHSSAFVSTYDCHLVIFVVPRYGRKKRVWDGEADLFTESKSNVNNRLAKTRKRSQCHEPQLLKSLVQLHPKPLPADQGIHSCAVSETTNRVKKASTEATGHSQQLSPTPDQAYFDNVSNTISLETRQKNLEILKQKNELLNLALVSWKEQLSEEMTWKVSGRKHRDPCIE